MASTEVVRHMFEAYLAGDDATARALLADDFTFTSPQDDHIDRDAFMADCFPTAERVAWQELLHVVSDGGDGVFVMYEYGLKEGGRHRNTEHIVVRGGQLAETTVFFGGTYDGAA